jgi:hypothetical protein
MRSWSVITQPSPKKTLICSSVSCAPTIRSMCRIKK